MNKVYDEITEEIIGEIWNRETPDDDETIRLNGKYVWETAKRVCQYINTYTELISITSFSEYRTVMRKVMKVIKEAHNLERKRRQASRKKRIDETNSRTQKVKALIARVRRGEMRKEEIVIMLEEIFGRGSGQEIEKATTKRRLPRGSRKCPKERNCLRPGRK